MHHAVPPARGRPVPDRGYDARQRTVRVHRNADAPGRAERADSARTADSGWGDDSDGRHHKQHDRRIPSDWSGRELRRFPAAGSRGPPDEHDIRQLANDGWQPRAERRGGRDAERNGARPWRRYLSLASTRPRPDGAGERVVDGFHQSSVHRADHRADPVGDPGLGE